MPELADGESVEIQGSARTPYVLKNIAGVYSCSCPSWRNQSLPIDQRSCKHLAKLRGEEAERQRIGGLADAPAGDLTTREKTTKKPTPPLLLLAQPWTCDIDPTDWLLSEKLDGIRAYWDGSRFISRQGNPFHAPDWFTKGLPNIPLDGELWLARKAFGRTMSIVRSRAANEHWRDIRYLVFDSPAECTPFEDRLAFLRETLGPLGCEHVRVHVHYQCLGAEHLRTELAHIESLGGEGIMLRQPGSLYEPCRSPTLLKVKTFHDAEATVIEHLPGQGRHAGRLGALLVALADGTEFSVGTGFSDAQRKDPPPIGSVIMFRYQELTEHGVPRFAAFVRVADSNSLASNAAELPLLTTAAAKPRR